MVDAGVGREDGAVNVVGDVLDCGSAVLEALRGAAVGAGAGAIAVLAEPAEGAGSAG